jgi:hypothetical protein
LLEQAEKVVFNIPSVKLRLDSLDSGTRSSPAFYTVDGATYRDYDCKIEPEASGWPKAVDKESSTATAIPSEMGIKAAAPETIILGPTEHSRA